MRWFQTKQNVKKKTYKYFKIFNSHSIKDIICLKFIILFVKLSNFEKKKFKSMINFSKMHLENAQLVSLYDLFACEFEDCGKLMENPYVLACGHIICVDHINLNEKKFKCNHCKKRIYLQNKSIIHIKMRSFIDILFRFNDNDKKDDMKMKSMKEEPNSSSDSIPKKVTTISRVRSNLETRFNRLLKRRLIVPDNNLESANFNDSKETVTAAAAMSSTLDTVAEQYSSDESYNQLESTVRLDLSSISNIDKKPNYNSFSYLSSNRTEFTKTPNHTTITKIIPPKLRKPSREDSIPDHTTYHSEMGYLEGRYIGQFVDGRRNGYGVFYFNSGDKYEGYWVNDKRNGNGTYYFKQEECKYVGDWKNDLRHGKGFLIDHARSRLQIWENGKLKEFRI